jgi:hypothetical protein
LLGSKKYLLPSATLKNIALYEFSVKISPDSLPFDRTQTKNMKGGAINAKEKDFFES